MKSALNRRQLLFILIFCLLLHALLLIGMLVIELYQRDTELYRPDPAEATIIIENEQEQPFNDHDWVALERESAAAADIGPSVESKAEPNQPSEEKVPEKLVHQEPQKQQEPPLSDAAIDDAVAIAQHIIDDSEHIAPTTIKTQPKSEQKQDHPIEKREEPPLPFKVAPIDNKLTFQKLAQGFVQHLEQGALKVETDNKGVASIEQLKHLHYIKKIIDCLENSAKINEVHLPAQKKIEATLIKFALNRDGSIHTLQFVKTSGNPAMDRFIMHVFRDASSSFPPVPAFFKEQPYQLPLFSIDPERAAEAGTIYRVNRT